MSYENDNASANDNGFLGIESYDDKELTIQARKLAARAVPNSGVDHRIAELFEYKTELEKRLILATPDASIGTPILTKKVIESSIADVNAGIKKCNVTLARRAKDDEYRRFKTQARDRAIDAALISNGVQMGMAMRARRSPSFTIPIEDTKPINKMTDAEIEANPDLKIIRDAAIANRAKRDMVIKKTGSTADIVDVLLAEKIDPEKVNEIHSQVIQQFNEEPVLVSAGEVEEDNLLTKLQNAAKGRGYTDVAE